MAFFDLPLEQLKLYQPPRNEPDDFDAFWHLTIEQTRQYPLKVQFEPVGYGLKTIEAFDVSYCGYGGQTIKAWLLLPSQRSGRLPLVVEYIGYGGGRGFPTDWLFWASMGCAHFVMDTRGQGSVWRKGDTPDLEPEGSSPHAPGFMTLGVLSPETYYYRRVFMDALRAVEAARSHPAVDPQRVALTGGSQGGGITIAVAGLAADIAVWMPDVPYLCHMRRATEVTDAYPYQEIVQFCQTHRDKEETVFKTLSYFDGVNFAARAHGRALFSVALMDDICPPSTVFAAYNHFNGEKDIRIYTFNHHEGGGPYQDLEKLHFLRSIWAW